MPCRGRRVEAVARVLLSKSPVALKATKDAIRRVGEMTYDNAEDYLVRAQEAVSVEAVGRVAAEEVEISLSLDESRGSAYTAAGRVVQCRPECDLA